VRAYFLVGGEPVCPTSKTSSATSLSGGSSDKACWNSIHGCRPLPIIFYFKAIFDKVGVRSRRELVGQVFAQHYQPRMATRQEPKADGWFT
jgi:hypothetical protein